MNKDQKIYVREDDVRFRKPMDEPSGIEKMPKGQELLYVDGPWVRVTKNGQTGWVHAEYVTETNPNPDPSPLQTPSGIIKFAPGAPNPATAANTIEARKVIGDVLNGGKNGWDLQCTEYVGYRLKTKLGIDIKWPVTSGRHGGKWALIFEQHKTYPVLNEPKINCAVSFAEIRHKDGTLTEEGHVAFVEAVLPDGSIQISEANWPGEGKYSERTLSRDKWQNQYKGRFVDFPNVQSG